ncbi:hypothetical protein [Endozoicomonas sp. ALB091]|uniref:hypothetical protein n=1 Tax=Endozoicomonas sp. ALB091 TaxID=3403073 RepID=UPI003BB4CC14
MSPVYPNQFFGWMPATKVFWINLGDMETVYEYKGRRRVNLKRNATCRAAVDANEIIYRLVHNIKQ